MKKYRIKEEHTADGTVYFIPQKRFLFFYENLHKTNGNRVSLRTIQAAEEYIAERMATDARHAKAIANRKVTKRVYHKYKPWKG